MARLENSSVYCWDVGCLGLALNNTNVQILISTRECIYSCAGCAGCPQTCIFHGGSLFNQSGHLGKSGRLFGPPWKMTGGREEFVSLKLLDVSGHAFLAICVTL